MALRKLKFTKEEIKEIAAYRKKLNKQEELDPVELFKIKGGCGGLCEVTCSLYCRPVCTANCEINCWNSCGETCNTSGHGCDNCTYTWHEPYPI